MLKCDKGSVAIVGSAIDLLAEYSCLTYEMYGQFSEAIGSEEEAKEALTKSFKAGLRTKGELSAEMEDEKPGKIDLLRTKDALDRLLEMMEEKMKGENADGRGED